MTYNDIYGYFKDDKLIKDYYDPTSKAETIEEPDSHRGRVENL